MALLQEWWFYKAAERTGELENGAWSREIVSEKI
jgi:hypothetical protein